MKNLLKIENYLNSAGLSNSQREMEICFLIFLTGLAFKGYSFLSNKYKIRIKRKRSSAYAIFYIVKSLLHFRYSKDKYLTK